MGPKGEEVPVERKTVDCGNEIHDKKYDRIELERWSLKKRVF